MFNPNKIFLYSLSFLKYAEDLNPKQKLISFIEEAMDLIDYSFVISRDINKEDKILKLKSIKEQATNIIKEAAKIAIQFENSKELKQQYGFTYSQRGGGYVDKVKEIAETIKSYILFSLAIINKTYNVEPIRIDYFINTFKKDKNLLLDAINLANIKDVTSDDYKLSKIVYTPKNSNNSELNIKSTTSLSTLKDIFIVNRLLPSDSIQDPNELDETENFSTVNVASSIKDSIQNNANIPQANKIIDYLKSNPNKLILFAFKKHSFHYQIVEDMIKNNEFEWDKISKDNIYTLLQQGYDIKMSVFKSMLDKANDYFQNGLNESSAKVLSYLLMNFSNFNTSEQKQVIIFILDNFKTEDYSKLLSFINKKSIVYLISIAHISNAMTKQFLTNIYQAELPENYNEPEKFDSESMYSFHEYEYKDKDSEYTLSPDLNRINNFDTKHHNEIINYLSNRDEYLSNILDLFIENNYKEVSKDRELRTIKDTSNLLNFIKNTKYSGQIYGTNLLDLLLIYSPNSLGKQIISTFSKDNEYSMESVISSFIFLYKDYDTTPRIYDLIESNYNYVFSSEQFVSYINNKINNYIHNSDTIRNLDAICEIIKVHSNNDVKLKIKEAASKIYVYYPKTNDATKDSILQACNI